MCWSTPTWRSRIRRPSRPIGLELQLEAQVGGLLLRGIIDRLEEDADGELVVTDYKTGKAPPLQYEQGRLGGVHFYAFLCEQALGRRPAIIRLMYLRDGTVIEARPTDRSVRFLPRRTEAVWRAISQVVRERRVQAAAGPALLHVRLPGLVPCLRW